MIILTCKAISGYPWAISIISMSRQSTNQGDHFNLRGVRAPVLWTFVVDMNDRRDSLKEAEVSK
jgi:hypothetical protein